MQRRFVKNLPFWGNDSDGNDDEEATTPQNQNQTFAEDMEKHTPRTPSAKSEWAPLEPEGIVESGISPRSRPSVDQMRRLKGGHQKAWVL